MSAGVGLPGRVAETKRLGSALPVVQPDAANAPSIMKTPIEPE